MLRDPDRRTVDHLQIALVGGRHGLENPIPHALLPPAQAAIQAKNRDPSDAIGYMAVRSFIVSGFP